MHKIKEDLDAREELQNLATIMKQRSLLDILLKVEDFLDEMNLYVYPNWIEGTIAQGPELSKYWVSVTLKYQYKDMPDPQGAKVLSNIGVKVEFEKEKEIKSKKIKPKRNIITSTNRTKRIKRDIWLVHLNIPRRFIDEIELEKLKTANLDNDEVDAEDISSATDAGYEEDKEN